MTPTHSFTLQSGLLGKKQILVITPEDITFDGVRVDQTTFVDVKYSTEYIVWYKFYVGVAFRIDIKYEDTKVLTLKFSKYAWKNKHYSQMYSDISSYTGNYFLLKRINATLEHLDKTGHLELLGQTITPTSITFDAPKQTILLSSASLKEYSTYFVIFDKSNPEIHKRISFDQWNAELLFNVVKNLVA